MKVQIDVGDQVGSHGCSRAGVPTRAYPSSFDSHFARDASPAQKP